MGFLQAPIRQKQSAVKKEIVLPVPTRQPYLSSHALHQSRNLEEIAAPVPGTHNPMKLYCIASRALQRYQNLAGEFSSSPSVTQKKSVVKNEISAPVLDKCYPTDQSYLSRSQNHARVQTCLPIRLTSKYDSSCESTQSSKHQPNEKKIFTRTEMQQALISSSEKLNKQEPELLPLRHSVHPSHLSSVLVKLELGHTFRERDMPTNEFPTFDWKVFVRGLDGCAIEHFVRKVVFRLHDSYHKPIRVRREPPFQLTESGIAGFTMGIDVYFHTKEEPRKVSYIYDLFLFLGEEVTKIRLEKLTFHNPGAEFRKKLLLGGGVKTTWSDVENFNEEQEQDGDEEFVSSDNEEAIGDSESLSSEDGCKSDLEVESSNEEQNGDEEFVSSDNEEAIGDSESLSSEDGCRSDLEVESSNEEQDENEEFVSSDNEEAIADYESLSSEDGCKSDLEVESSNEEQNGNEELVSSDNEEAIADSESLSSEDGCRSDLEKESLNEEPEQDRKEVVASDKEEGIADSESLSSEEGCRYDLVFERLNEEQKEVVASENKEAIAKLEADMDFIGQEVDIHYPSDRSSASPDSSSFEFVEDSSLDGSDFEILDDEIICMS